jgi:hypothetical protein
MHTNFEIIKTRFTFSSLKSRKFKLISKKMISNAAMWNVFWKTRMDWRQKKWQKNYIQYAISKEQLHAKFLRNLTDGDILEVYN